MPLSSTRIRLQMDARSREVALDVNTANTPQIWRGVDVDFELGVFDGDALANLEEIDSITLEVKRDGARLGPAVMRKTIGHVDLEEITLEQWAAGTLAQGVIRFTGAETNVDLQQADRETFWLVISAITTHSPSRALVLGVTKLEIVEDGAGADDVLPPLPLSDYYTKAESDARYQSAAVIDDLTEQVDDHEGRITTHETRLNGQDDDLAGLAEEQNDQNVAIAQKIPLSQKGAAGGVATLGSDLKVPYTQLPDVATPGGSVNGLMSPGQAAAVADVANKIATAARGAANGVASLDATGKVPLGQLPTLGGGGGTLVISWDDPDPDVVANPAYKSVLLIRRGTSLITVPPLNDGYFIWNEGDGGGVAQWWPLAAVSGNPRPLIFFAYSNAGQFGVGFWLGPGTAVGSAALYTIDGSDPVETSPPAPAYPSMVSIVATTGVSWTDGSGTHYRHTLKARTFHPSYPKTVATTVTMSVNADGTYYSTP